jgi:hypothetical protein
MAIYTWPAWLKPAEADFALQKAAAVSVSPFNGSVEPHDYVAERWVVSVTLPACRSDEEGYRRVAFLNRLPGALHRVMLGPFLWGQYAPAGTLRGSPTLQVDVARGSDTVSISGSGTLQAGDWLGIGPQLFQVANDCASSSGVISVPLVNRVRAVLAAGTAVVWDRPTGAFILPASQVRALRRPAVLEAVTLDFLEVWGTLILNTETGQTLFTETGEPLIVI